jgi:hypothetical protein
MLTKSFRQYLGSAACSGIFLVGLSLGTSPVFAAPQSISSEKELSAALRSEKTPEDHLRISAYYKEKAQTLQRKEKEEQELADYFATHPSMYGKQYPTPYENHKWRAENYQREASEALQKATQHQEAAESLSASSH